MIGRSRDRRGESSPATISIIGPGMQVVGDCVTDGTLRIEGQVEGSVYAAKAVVVGKDGMVMGNVRTQDAVIAGRVTGTLLAASRLEVHEGACIEGDVRARRMQLDEGAVLNGDVRMGEIDAGPAPAGRESRGAAAAEALEPTAFGQPEKAGRR